MTSSGFGLPIGNEIEGVCKLAAGIAAADPKAWDLARAVELCRLHRSPQEENDYAKRPKRPKVVVAGSDARLSDISLAVAHGGAFVVGLPKRPAEAGPEVVEHIIDSALTALRSERIDVLMLVDPKLSCLLRAADGPRCLLQSRTKQDQLKAVLVGSDLQRIDRLNRLLATFVDPMRVGVSLNGYRVIDLAERRVPIP